MEAVRESSNPSNAMESLRNTSTHLFYICARFGRQAEARLFSKKLEMLGHTITSTWVDQVELEMYRDSDPRVWERAAVKDVHEVMESDALIYLSEVEENEWGRGGRHVEFGVALGLEIPIFVIGPKENLFHFCPRVQHFETQEDFIRALKGA